MFAFDFSTTVTNFRPDVQLVEAAPERLGSTVTMVPDQPWNRYIDGLAEKRLFQPHHLARVREYWQRIRAHVGPRLSSPVTQPTSDGALQLYWESNNKYMEVDIYADGTIHWFYKDVETGEVDGTDVERERGVAHIMDQLITLVVAV